MPRRLPLFAFLFLLACSSKPSSPAAPSDLLEEALTPSDGLPSERLLEDAMPLLPSWVNELCERARVSRLEFRDLQRIEAQPNYCEVAIERLPVEVRGTLEKIGAIHEKIAEAVGLPADTLFGRGYRVTFRGYESGSLASRSDAQGVTLMVLPDWTLEDFPSSIYAHEIVHVLAFNPGPMSEVLRGLRDHPVLFEALPDLISAVIHDSPVIRLGESSLHPLLREYRDATPIRSFDEPFRVFYRFANADSIVERCKRLDRASESPVETRICETAEKVLLDGLVDWAAKREERGVKSVEFTEKTLAEVFSVEKCVSVARSGLAFFDQCDPHQFSYPLVSFFFRLKELTGRHHLRSFIENLRVFEGRAPIQECRYAKDGANAKSFEMKIRSLREVFQGLRAGLSKADRAHFDQAWDESGFAKLAAIDRFYQQGMFPLLRQVAAASNDPEFANRYGCTSDDLYRLDPALCRVDCDLKKQ